MDAISHGAANVQSMDETDNTAHRTQNLPRLLSASRSAGRWLTNLAMPPVCVSCHHPLDTHDRICSECWSDVDFIRAPLCERLGIPLPYGTGAPMISAAAAAIDPAYDRARAVAHYSGVMRKLIHDYKYRDHFDARRLFVSWLVVAGRDLIETADLIVPTPLHRFRLLKRRFNQSALLSRDLASRVSKNWSPGLLQRIRRTRPQVGLTLSERRTNLAGAFRLKPGSTAKLGGKRVLLIDDVITTGATAQACAKILKSGGACAVDVLALAMVCDRGRMTT